MTAAGLTHGLRLHSRFLSGGRNSQFVFITWFKVGGKEGNGLIFNSSVTLGPGEQVLAQGVGHLAACACEHPTARAADSPAACSQLPAVFLGLILCPKHPCELGAARRPRAESGLAGWAA